MALINRVTRLLSADLHAVLDRLEEPEILIQQAIRDMEQDLDERECGIRLLRQKKRQLETQSQQTRTSLEGLQEELDLCLDANNEALAKTLIRKRLEAQAFLSNTEQKLNAWSDEIKDLESQFRDDQSQLEALRQKADAFNTDTGVTENNWSTSSTVTDEDVDVALLKEKHLKSRTKGKTS
ncbi:MAG: PspA/IM30 family protein [Pseudomonadota bacterium]